MPMFRTHFQSTKVMRHRPVRFFMERHVRFVRSLCGFASTVVSVTAAKQNLIFDLIGPLSRWSTPVNF